MLPYIRHNQTNWIDGMKVNKDHFIAIENNLTGKYHDSIALRTNSFNYGILPGYSGKPSFDVSIDLDKNGLLRVNIQELRAITNAGVRIEISNSNQRFSQQSSFVAEVDMKALNGRDFYVVLSVNPFGRVPVGEPDPEEVPPRYPFADYQYAVNVVRADELLIPSSGYYHLCIGKVSVAGNNWELVEDYLPPASTLSSLELLVEFYEHLDRVLSKLEADCTIIIQKIYTKKQNDILPASVKYLAEAVIQYLSSTLTNYRWFLREQPPAYMFAYFSSLARVIKNTVDLKLGDGKEEMLNYFKNWIVEINQGEFEQVMDEMVNINYNHLEIGECLRKLEAFYKTVNTVFNKLAKLDYIGDKGKFNPIVKTQMEQAAPVKKKRDWLLE